MDEIKLGIDDAGRGPVIGPMVIAGCIIDKKTEEEFKKLRMKESKQLTQKRREFFEEIIKRDSLGFEVKVISPEEIDKANEENLKLNELEALAFAEIINKLNSKKEKIKVILDCPSVSIAKWKDFLRIHVEDLSNLDLVCEHKADKNHIVAAAASILAKTERERQIESLKENYGNIGSGYSSDAVTQKFLEKNAEKFKDDGIFRKSWSTWKKAYQNISQRKLQF